MDAAETPTVDRFHNAAPIEEYFIEVNSELPARLEHGFKGMIERADALIDNAKELPAEVVDENDEKQFTDIAGQIAKHMKAVDSRRLAVNDGARQAQTIINNFARDKILVRLESAVKPLDEALKKFKRIKAEKERREREEKARLAREEEERKQREAEEAERRRREAEAAARRAEEERRRAEEAKARAIEEAKAAEARKRVAEQQAREAEERAQAAKTKAAKEKAEREAQEARDRAAAEQRARDDAKRQQEEERERAAQAATDASLAKGDLRDATKEARTAGSLARSAGRDADRAERSAGAGQAELSGARGDFGTQSGLRTKWVGEVVDRNKLDLEPLRDFMSDGDLERFVNAFARVHKGDRRVRGARFYEDDSLVKR